MTKSVETTAPKPVSGNRFSRVFDWINNMLAYICGILVIFLMFLIGAEVVLRRFAGFNIPWATEVTENAVLFVAFAAAAWLLRQNRHVNVDIVIMRLSKSNQDLMAVVTSIIGAVLCLFMTYRAFYTMLDVWRRGAATVTVMEFPLAPFMAIIAVGLLLLTIQFSRHANNHLQKWRGAQKSAVK